MSRLVFITGLSGAGRSVAAAALSDLGWFVIDNLPVTLLPQVAELASDGGKYDRVALVMAASDQDLGALIQELRVSVGDVQVVFLEASDEVLLRRFESSKRPHPFGEGASLVDAIAGEREALASTRSLADLVISTTHLTPYELRHRMSAEFAGPAASSGLNLTVSSFGFKHGIPLDVDMVIDCRFLPNPYWDEALRPLRGTDEVIRDYVLNGERATRFLERLEGLLDELMPAYAEEGRSYLNVAFGCTGGHHRSVAVAEHVAQLLNDRGWMPRVKHRDLEK